MINSLFHNKAELHFGLAPPNWIHQQFPFQQERTNKWTGKEKGILKKESAVLRRKIDVLSFGLIICGVFMFYLCSVEALALVNHWPNEANQLGCIDLG